MRSSWATCRKFLELYHGTNQAGPDRANSQWVRSPAGGMPRILHAIDSRSLRGRLSSFDRAALSLRLADDYAQRITESGTQVEAGIEKSLQYPLPKGPLPST